ncbi:phosphatase PAP2 family protein [Mesoplasma melaleucae]|uniref:Phosphatidic acid phosphatase type 2/haloperoxidase domain-containing protein n=1 Tax=Mesoplasma melaleucae TaxID=81459 RepID=A0A2K8NWE5_9MOLU|nr:phosphatase PAP2 family protein [Mesoplasma melaleucae]ATZ18162.1 hypothetical protein EMELA_v1c06550 [Mesoplasma melaleucae]
MKLRIDRENWKKSYLYLFISIGIALFTIFMVGTFLDAQIAKEIYQKESCFGYAFDKFGQLTFLIPVNFCIVGIIIWLENKYKEYSVQTFIFKVVYFTVIYAATLFYLFTPLMRKNQNLHIHELSVDIFNTIVFWLIFIATSIFYKLNANFTDQKNFAWKVGLVICYIIAIILTTELLKNIFSRPRPITTNILNSESEIDFREWWNITYTYGFGKNKSFPSGHTTSAITILGLALLFKKDSLYYYGIILISFIFAILVGTSRMILGKHFLTDITFATIIAVSWYLLFENCFFKTSKQKTRR